MKFVKDISEYSSKSERIEGWRPLTTAGLNIPNPVKVVTHEGFLFFKEHGVTGELKEEVLNAYREIGERNPGRGVYAGRGYYVPNLQSPPGPRSASVRSESVILEEVQKLFEFAINSKFDIPGAEINLIMHPFINPVLPMSGGCITPSGRHKDELIVEAIYGNDEGVQSFYHDTFYVDVNKMVILKKDIQKKPECLQATEDFKYETIKVPAKYQEEQCISDFTVLTVAREFKKVLDKYGPKRVEFAVQEDGVFFRDCTPFEFPKEDKSTFIDTKGTVLRVSSVTDLVKLNKNGYVVFIDPSVIQKRNMDLLTSIALSVEKKIIVLYPGTATTAHAVTILREKGHHVVYVGNQTFKTGEKVFVSKKGGELVVEKLEDSIYVISEENFKATRNNMIGGKSARIIELQNKGFKVPRYFIITTDTFEAFIEDNDLEKEIELLSGEKNRDKIKPLAQKLREKVLNGKVSREVEDSILQAFNKLHSNEVAVRSSANVEDSKTASFAGQFETFLAVTKDNLIEAVKKCWASSYGDSVIAYASSHGVPTSSIKMAVLVMEMLQPKSAGVIFTKDVLDNDTNKIIVEAAEGLGEQVVDGTVEPNRVILDKASGNILSRTGNGVLSEEDIKELFNQSMKIEKLYKSPQDIEFAFTKEGFFVLQTRPITV